MKTTLLCLLLLGAAVPGLRAETRFWNGAGTNTLWSNPDNWTNGVPQSGDSIVLLRHPLGLFQSAINDLTNLTVQDFRCEAIGFNLNGGNLRVAGDVLLGGPVAGANMTWFLPVELLAPTVHLTGTNSSELAVNGPLSAAPTTTVIVNGGFRPRIAGFDYRATTRLESGFLPLVSTRVGGPFVIGGTTNFASVAIQSGNALFDFPALTILTNGSVQNVATVNAAGPLLVDGGSLNLGGASPLGRLSLNGSAVLQGGATLTATAFSSGVPGELSVTGAVTLAGCRLRILQANYVPGPSVLIRNDGVDPIVGTLDGLPEGALTTDGRNVYRLSYVGGDGNDLTMTPLGRAFLSALQTGPGGTVSVTGLAGTNVVVSLEMNPALGGTNWTSLAVTNSDDDGRFSFENLPLGAGGFYRVALP